MIDEFIAKNNLIDKELGSIGKRYNFISFLRFISFFASVILLYMGLSDKKNLLSILGISAAVLFIVFLKIHSVLDDKMINLKSKKEVNEGYIARFDGKWREFSDNGSEFLAKEDMVSRDIDLLGNASLYQFISIAHTDNGKKKLADTVSLKKSHIDTVKERNEAVNELSGKIDFLVGFESVSARISKRKRRKSLQEFEEKKEKCPFIVPILMALIPVVNAAVIIMAIAGKVDPKVIIFTMFGCLLITEFCSGIRNKFLYPIHVLGNGSKDYYALLKLIDEEEFDSELLKDIKDRVGKKNGIINAIKSLIRLSEADNISFNPIVHMALNATLGWDLWLTMFAAGWNKKYSGSINECMEVIGDVEELSSLSIISVVGNTCKPEIIKADNADKDSIMIDAKDVYHPLIGCIKAVANSASISRGATVITGSNMSGKTTFLRTLAINMALAYMGANTCAESMKLPFMKIFTSMRVMDDVAGGISTFYAEILRIKEMAEYIASSPEIPAACFIDEIFKGTNSADRIVGAENAIKKLSEGSGFVVVTTHDFELCELKMSDGRDVKNYHFEEYYEDDELKFDYMIKDGRCTTRNAMTLLKMAGLVS